MGMGGISIWQLLIILVIVLLLFGTKKLKNLGTDLGGAIKGFRSAMNDGDRKEEKDGQSNDGQSNKAQSKAQLSAQADASVDPGAQPAGDKVTPADSSR